MSPIKKIVLLFAAVCVFGNGLFHVGADANVSIVSVSINKHHPKEVILSQQIDFNDKVVIIVDDVVSSGKTLLYSIKPFLEFHPKKIQTLVLVERSYKNFPVTPDYVGISIATTLQDHIFVEVKNDEVTGAYLV